MSSDYNLTGQDVYPQGTIDSLRVQAINSWQPQHMQDPPAPPPQDTREQELAALAAQEKLGHDGKRQRVRARRTVDPFGGLERWKIVSQTAVQGDQDPPILINTRCVPAVSYNSNLCRRQSLHQVKSELSDQREHSRSR